MIYVAIAEIEDPTIKIGNTLTGSFAAKGIAPSVICVHPKI